MICMYIKKDQEYVHISKTVWAPILFTGLILILVATVVVTVMVMNPFGSTNFAELSKFNEGISMLKESYYEEIETETLLDGVLWGASTSMGDPYTVYMTQEEAKSFIEDIESDDYAGVGLYIYLDETDNRITVSQPIEGSPADEAGIGVGDKILKVDGEATDKFTLDQAAAKMKGAEGTEVVLTILKAESGETLDVKIVRAIVERNTVSSKMATDKTAYIQITQFGINTHMEFIEAYNKLVGEGMEKLVIDLRNNTGGYLDQAVGIADEFLDEGVIVYTMNRDGQKHDYNANKQKTKVPMVILVNGSSASASEVLVGALKDYGKATIIGEKTFGKGVTQITREFSDGSLMKITDSRYYTPNGVCIDHEGIKPDVEIEMAIEKYAKISDLTLEEDEQLKRAVEFLEQ